MTMLESLPIIDVASLILAVFLGYLAVREYVDHRTEKLEKELKMVNSALTRERYAFSDKALQMYGVKDHQLLYRDGWVVPFRAGVLMEDVLAVESDAPVNVGDTRHPRWMPYRGLTYSDNVKMTLGKKISYLPIYALAEEPKTEGGSVTVPVRTCQYCQFFDTCDYLSFEIAHAMRIRRIPPEAIRMPDLPYRSSIEPYDLSNRHTGIGISTLTVVVNIPDEIGQVFLVHNRKGKTAEGGEVYHAVPAGSYEPIDGMNPETHGNRPFDSAFREFIEEVIDTRYDFVSSPDLLKYFSEKVHADIFYLGIGLEPLNLKAEMMSLMIVDFQMSSLFDDSVEDLFKDRKETDEGGIRVVPFREEFIDHYANSRKSFTTFREMLRIVRQDFDSIKNHKVEGTVGASFATDLGDGAVEELA